VETVDAGIDTLAGTNPDHIFAATLNRPVPGDNLKNLFGDGDSGEKSPNVFAH
jgi:hypothetical protein